MSHKSEFEKYAVKHRGISSNTLNSYASHLITALTPNIIEERPMNVAVMDVYSRLMMDRIIFLGYPINDEVANIVTAQLLFLDSTDRTRDIICTLTVLVVAFIQAWACTIQCSMLPLMLLQFVLVLLLQWHPFFWQLDQNPSVPH